MFRNPVYDLMVVVPALLITGLLGFLIMTTAAHAQVLDVSTGGTSTGARAVTASTSGTTLPDPLQKSMVITRADIHADEKAPQSALGVRTSADLLAYAQTSLAADPYIESISLSTQGIAVRYRRSGLLLGLVPVALPTIATVHQDGSVSFTDPWYGAVSIAGKDRMRTALEVRVHALLTSEGYLESMQLAPETQAELLDIVRELLA